MSVTVFGIGYVGLVQAAVLSEVGHNVCCVDIDGAGQIKLADPLIQAKSSFKNSANLIVFQST